MIISDNLKNLSEIFHKTPLYIVGGYVRDFLLGKTTCDIDICSKLTTNEVVQLLKNTKYKTVVVNEKLGTVLILADNEKYEYTPFRVDSYIGGEHSPSCVEFNVDISSDALRRDFTINAIYYDIKNDKIVDIVGGKSDLEKRLLKAVREPDKVFFEDPLRVIRLIRLSAVLGFDIDKSTFDSAKKYASFVHNLSGERVVDEYKKLTEKASLSDVLYFVDMLGEMGVINSLYGENKVEIKHRFVSGMLNFATSLELLYLAIYEKYFSYKINVKTAEKLDTFDGIKTAEKSVFTTLDKIFGKDKLPNKVKSNFYKLVCLFEFYVVAKNNISIDILITYYYNNICTYQLMPQTRMMVKNPIFYSILQDLSRVQQQNILSTKDLAICASDVKELGYKNSDIAKVLNFALESVLLKKVDNTKENLQIYIRSNYDHT